MKNNRDQQIQQQTRELALANELLEKEIIEHKRVEEILREKELRLHRYYELSPIGMATTSLEKEWIEFNDRLCELFGYTREELCHLTWSEITHPDDLARDVDQFNRVLAGEIDGYAMDKRFIRKDGSILYAHIIAQCVRLPDQTIDHFVAFVEDITERRKAEEALRERTNELSKANAKMARIARSKDEFLANMSHELRTPLNSILGFAETLQEFTYGPLNNNQVHAIKTIETSGRHLLSLINDILDLSKIEAGRMELNIGSVVILHLCQASMQFIKQQAFKKSIASSLDIQTDLKTISADERRLKQVLVNLLNNAVKFTPEGGKIGLEVTADLVQRTIQFSVWDTGIGIEPAYMERLFQPFVQIDSDLNRQHEGTGLGLSLVAKITELHHGRVEIQSDVGKGSRFTIVLPIAQMDSLAKIPEQQDDMLGTMQSSAPKYHCTGPLLLAEDNESTIEILYDYLSAKGFCVLIARNGEEAIARIQEERPSLILMDIQMPKMDGLKAIHHIRTVMGMMDIPIIALTALTMTGDRQRCLDAGATDYMSKPINLQALFNMITVHYAKLEPQRIHTKPPN